MIYLTLSAFFMNKIKGFTLVELLVVMAIIGFLTVGSYAGLTFGLRQARDTQRKTIVTTLNTALLAYYADFQKYPSSTGNPQTANLLLACNQAVLVATNYKRCTGSFDATNASGLTGSAGTKGVKDYLEGSFSWGPYTTDVNDRVGYYVTTGDNLRYAVCTVLENKSGGNVISKASGAGPDQKSCHCVGSDTAAVACQGLKEY
jgi:prepilin-type N-terminal cleavage/methylation domain-containing protein